MQQANQPQNPNQDDKVLRISLEPEVNKFEEYKLFVEDTARFSERRQTVTNIYIAVNGAIATLVTFMFNNAITTNSRIVLAILPLLVAGGFVCFLWYRLLFYYKRLLAFRFDQLEEMEKQLPGCHQMYMLERKYLFKEASRKERVSLSRTEMWLPQVFGGLYLVLVVFAILLLFIHLKHESPRNFRSHVREGGVGGRS